MTEKNKINFAIRHCEEGKARRSNPEKSLKTKYKNWIATLELKFSLAMTEKNKKTKERIKT